MDNPLYPSSKHNYLDYGAYDKNGEVFAIIRATEELKFKLNIKEFASPQKIKEFVDEITFMSYSFKGDFQHILLDNGYMSEKELLDHRLGDEPYTVENAKKNIEQLILDGELAVFITGDHIPPEAQNHHRSTKSGGGESGTLKQEAKHSLGPETNPDNEESKTPQVIAIAEVNGKIFTDVNQTARDDGDNNKPTLISDRIDKKSRKQNKDLPNGNMRDAHAEIGAIQQASDAGVTDNADMTITVKGEPVCGYCTGDIPAMAKEANLKSLTIIEEATGETLYWKPGMRSLKTKG